MFSREPVGERCGIALYEKSAIPQRSPIGSRLNVTSWYYRLF